MFHLGGSFRIWRYASVERWLQTHRLHQGINTNWKQLWGEGAGRLLCCFLTATSPALQGLSGSGCHALWRQKSLSQEQIYLVSCFSCSSGIIDSHAMRHWNDNIHTRSAAGCHSANPDPAGSPVLLILSIEEVTSVCLECVTPSLWKNNVLTRLARIHESVKRTPREWRWIYSKKIFPSTKQTLDQAGKSWWGHRLWAPMETLLEVWVGLVQGCKHEKPATWVRVCGKPALIHQPEVWVACLCHS